MTQNPEPKTQYHLHLVHYGPGPTSVTQKVVEKLKPFLAEKYNVDELDLVAQHPVFFDKQSMAAYVKRNYKKEVITESEEKTLRIPDELADRVIAADILVIVTPMYNFSIPGVVKTWIDNITQAKKLFEYTDYGPIGLSKIQKAIVIPITGSTPASTSKDFLTPYMDFILKFIGVKEVIFKGIYGTKFLNEAVNEKIEAVVEEVTKIL